MAAITLPVYKYKYCSRLFVIRLLRKALAQHIWLEAGALYINRRLHLLSFRTRRGFSLQHIFYI